MLSESAAPVTIAKAIPVANLNPVGLEKKADEVAGTAKTITGTSVPTVGAVVLL